MLHPRCLGVILPLCLVACAEVGAPRGGFDAGALRPLLERLRQEAGAPGAVLAVTTEAGESFEIATGVADRETGAPLREGTPYYFGSITKTYTAATVLRLADEGKLSLEDPLARFLPDFPRGGEITLRHLLSHTSGLKDFYTYLYFRPEREEMIRLVTKAWTQDELLALAGRFGHWFEPGTDWDYSSTNYFLLGVTIERASGMPLAEAFRHYLYRPLGLQRTWISHHEPGYGALPTGYMGPVAGWKHSEMFGELGPTTLLDTSSCEGAAGGLAAPAAEGARFLRALLRGDLLRPASLAAMTTFRPTPPLGGVTPPAAPGASADGYGLGLVRMERAGVTLIGHGGLYNGHTAGLWHLPDCDLTLALYFNRGFVDQRAVLDALVPSLVRHPDGSSRCAAGR